MDPDIHSLSNPDPHFILIKRDKMRFLFEKIKVKNLSMKISILLFGILTAIVSVEGAGEFER